MNNCLSLSIHCVHLYAVFFILIREFYFWFSRNWRRNLQEFLFADWIHENTTRTWHAYLWWLQICGEPSEHEEQILAVLAIRQVWMSCNGCNTQATGTYCRAHIWPGSFTWAGHKKGRAWFVNGHWICRRSSQVFVSKW